MTEEISGNNIIDEAAKAETQVLVPIEERTVDFYGDEISAALVQLDATGELAIYVPLRPLCEFMGLRWSSQFMRVQRDDDLREALTTVLMMRTMAGRSYEVACLPLELLPGWLFTIDVNRVKPELQPRIRQYRKECYKILWQAFQNRVLTTIVQQQPATTATEAQITQLSQQIQDLSDVIAFLQEHLEMMMQTSGQVSNISDRLNQAVQLLESLIEQQEQLTEHQQHLTEQQQNLTDQQQQLANQQEHLTHRQEHTESNLARIDERTNQLTPGHKRQIKDMVDSMVRQTRNLPTPLTYIIIYGRLKHRFNVAKYDEIADDSFDAVMSYLREELQRATNGNAPEQGTLF